MAKMTFDELRTIHLNYSSLRDIIGPLKKNTQEAQNKYQQYIRDEQNFYLREANEESIKLTESELSREDQLNILNHIGLDIYRKGFKGINFIASYLDPQIGYGDTIEALNNLDEQVQRHGYSVFNDNLWARISWFFKRRRAKDQVIYRMFRFSSVYKEYLDHQQEFEWLKEASIENEYHDISQLLKSDKIKTTDKRYSDFQKLLNIQIEIDQILDDYKRFRNFYITKMKEAHQKIDYIYDDGITSFTKTARLDDLIRHQPENRDVLFKAQIKGLYKLDDIKDEKYMMVVNNLSLEEAHKLIEIKQNFVRGLKNYDKARIKEYRTDKENKEILQILYAIRLNRDFLSRLEQMRQFLSNASHNKSYPNQRIYSFWTYQNWETEHLDSLIDSFNKFIDSVKDFDIDPKGYQRFEDDLNALSYDSLLKDFDENAADYYAILEKYFEEFRYTGQDENPGLLSDEIIAKIQNFVLDESLLKSVTLRSWQDFGSKYALIQKKVLVGDEMGLGKTLLAIAAMAHLAANNKKKHFLVICPKSILINWQREVKKHSKLNPILLHGLNREDQVSKWKQKGGVGITTFSTAYRLNLNDQLIDLLIVDEAHYVKNHTSNRGKYVRELTDKVDNTIYLTGTPIENRLEEFTGLLDNLQPTIAKQLKDPLISGYPVKYKKAIAPVYIRRTKEDVALELPELQQVEEWTEFGIEELDHYKEAVSTNNFMLMRRAAWLTNHKDSKKLTRLDQLVKEARANNQKVIIFSFFREVLNLVENKLGSMAVQQINGDTPSARRQEILDEFKDSKDKVALIAQVNTASHGLNIQFANIVIFCEPQIKPSLESQAIARAYRMGQVNNVTVYRILTENSVDELMMDMLDTKQRIFDEYADKSEIGEAIKERENQIAKKVQNKIVQIEKERLAV